MKVTLFMAISVNGMITRNNGSEDFLSNKNWNSFCKIAKKTKNIIVGRKTYEAVTNWNEDFNFDDLTKVTKVVVSKKKKKTIKGYNFVSSPKEALKLLKKKGFKDVLITGGSKLNSSFAKRGLINEIVLNIEPAVIGKGIPLFSKEKFDLKLKVIKIKKLENNLIQIHFTVK